MNGGVWIDLLLLALLAATLAVLYRLGISRSVLSAGPADPEEPAAPRGWLGRLIRQAGFDPGRMRWVYWVAKVALLALLPLLGLEVWSRWSERMPWALLAVLAILGFFLPDLMLLSARRTRRRRVRNGLSYFLDLMVALLHSGLNLEQAFRRTTREGMDPEQPLAQEAALVALELDVGRQDSAAFGAMAERTGVHELQGVAAALTTGRRLGISVAETLSAQADLMRTRRREAALRTINLASLKTLFPVFLCGYPLFMVIVLLPILIEISELLFELLGVL